MSESDSTARRRRPQTRPRHPRLGAAGFHAALVLLAQMYSRRHIYRITSRFAMERLRAVRAQLEQGNTVYLVGLAAGGMHNAGAALVEVSAERGPRIVCNNEEERFSGEKHTTRFPHHALADLSKTMNRIGIGPQHIAAWLGTWDYPLLLATIARSVLEELPHSANLLRRHSNPAFNPRHLSAGARNARHLAKHFGLDQPVPIIAMPHHDNHAWFSFSTSPFAHCDEPVAIAVLDGTGDGGSTTLYVAKKGEMRQLYCNNSIFDSLGLFYSTISSTQGGWTWLSSEGRYMGAAAFGNMDRASNPYYPALSAILSLEPNGEVRLNRSLANWHRDLYRNPYTPALVQILGEPIAANRM